jgi:hypothetical protein
VLTSHQSTGMQMCIGNNVKGCYKKGWWKMGVFFIKSIFMRGVASAIYIYKKWSKMYPNLNNKRQNGSRMPDLISLSQVKKNA